MVILNPRYPAPERSVENTVGALTHASPYIRSWYTSLQNVFKGYMMVSLVSHLPNLNVNYTPLNPTTQVWISIGSYGLTDQHSFYDWKASIRRSIKNLLQQVREGNENNKVIVCKRLIDSPLEIIKLDSRDFIQLVASLLNLYKDVLENEVCLIEKHKLATLKAELENLPRIRILADQESCNALKEMVLGIRECDTYRKECQKRNEIDGTKLEEGLQLALADMMYPVSQNTLENPKRRRREISMEQCSDWLKGLSEDLFINVYFNLGEYLPRPILEASLRPRSISTIINILQSKKLLFALVLPLDLLQKALREMSGSDLKVFLSKFSIKELTSILIDLPQSLLEQILLELPEDIVCDLKQEIVDGDLKKQIQESLLELKMAYEKSQSVLTVEERVVPSLASLAARAICQSPQKNLVGQGSQALSETSVDQILLMSPNLQEEVYSQLRVKVNLPIVDNSPHFTLVEPQSSGYKPELDLLSLASLVPGYEDVLKKTLLQKCSNQ